METQLVTDIQKYSIHDGEGIRTTIFFKGCPLSCIWCHNPETQDYRKQFMWNREKCTECGECAGACPSGAVSMDGQKPVTDAEKCSICHTCEEYCLPNAREFAGREYTVEDLVKEAVKDQPFYEQSHGGVTLSGGEVLARDMDFVERLMGELAERGIRVNVDTCGYVPWENIQRVLPYTDTFLYDIKVMDSDLHREMTGAGNEEILDNLIKLSESGAAVWIRIPVVGGVNDTDRNMKETLEFLSAHSIMPVWIHLLPYHNTGSGKYPRLGQEYQGRDFTTPSKERMRELADMCKKQGFQTEIGG